MPTEKPRVTFTVDQVTLSKIDEYRFSSKSKNQTQAILSLIEKGLADFESDNPSLSDNNRNSSYTVDEQSLINKYRTLDGYGKEAVDSILNIEHKRCAGQSEAPRPMIRAAARSGDITQIEEILPEELPNNTPLP